MKWVVITLINVAQSPQQNVLLSGLSSWVIQFLCNNPLFALLVRYFQDRSFFDWCHEPVVEIDPDTFRHR